MNQEIKAAWVEWLRNNPEKQSRELIRDKDKFSALGVLVFIVRTIINKININDNDEWFYCIRRKRTAPLILKHAELSESQIASIIEMDQEKTFLELADWIEENL